MKNCWASILGNCKGKISREHLVSQGLFLNATVRVQGFAWCKEEPKEIGLSALTAKILCEKHNNELSPIDTEGGKAFNSFREMRRLKNIREKMRPRIWNIVRYKVDGKSLERWFLKTLVNISYGSEFPIGNKESKPGKPSDAIVKIAFGSEQFEGRSGLYSVIYVGQNINSTDSLGFTPLIKDDEYIAGGIFVFRGFMFLLSLIPEGPPERLTGIQFNNEDLSAAQLNFHNKAINDIEGRFPSQVYELNW